MARMLSPTLNRANKEENPATAEIQIGGQI